MVEIAGTACAYGILIAFVADRFSSKGFGKLTGQYWAQVLHPLQRSALT
jgi:hypothetical protein